jgi:hypothetical protein
MRLTAGASFHAESLKPHEQFFEQFLPLVFQEIVILSLKFGRFISDSLPKKVPLRHPPFGHLGECRRLKRLETLEV